jgi:hypothetical protein
MGRLANLAKKPHLDQHRSFIHFIDASGVLKKNFADEASADAFIGMRTVIHRRGAFFEVPPSGIPTDAQAQTTHDALPPRIPPPTQDFFDSRRKL